MNKLTCARHIQIQQRTILCVSHHICHLSPQTGRAAGTVAVMADGTVKPLTPETVASAAALLEKSSAKSPGACECLKVLAGSVINGQ